VRGKEIYYRIMVPDSGTLEAGDVVIKLNGIFARKAKPMARRIIPPLASALGLA